MFDLVPFRRRNRQMQGQDPMESLINSFFDDSFTSMTANFKTDIIEQEDKYVIEAELPGMHKDDIELEIDNDRLTISANQTHEVKEEEENYIRRERRTGSFQRSFYIDNVQEDDIKASYDNGILKIYLPKKEPTKPKRREIEIE
ncbi:Hsp20/alpha crystallin family protein [Halanaerobiaceae bacterium Z-7014]|uniref:Hsp20/alpha crystallin family protein n=1 Tax=Halonatronomonas betaini TaxID=2778430 RepID=A0A931ARY7_9FIRM|nr:Hsp20/alpha crystallin family protein [Halonatronomonas betaini]MBF8437913.1 Hsp20/alpha crystallin family protein [Halonatronomonas betaini]